MKKVLLLSVCALTACGMNSPSLATPITTVMPSTTPPVEMTSIPFETSTPLSQATSAPVTSMSPTVVAAPTINTASPEYVAYSADKLAALKGKAPVLLFFHAAWCPTCQKMEKNITAELSTFPKGTVILKANYDTETALKKQYDIRVQSTVVLLDANGKVVFKSQDPSNQTLKSELSKVL